MIAAGARVLPARPSYFQRPTDVSMVFFGEGASSTYGQTFIVPAVDNVLKSFQFTVAQSTPTPVDFYFYVMAWNGVSATGPVLFQSDVFTTPGPIGRYALVVNPNLSLTSGNSYVAFINDSLLLSTPPTGGLLLMDGRGSLVNPSFGAYSGGKFVTLFDGSNFSNLTTVPWSSFTDFNLDAAFRAEFVSSSSVPDSGRSVGQFCGALAMLGALKRRSRRFRIYATEGGKFSQGSVH